MIFGWCSPEPAQQLRAVLSAMQAALQAPRREPATLSVVPGLAIGVWPPAGDPGDGAVSVQSADGQRRLWMAGEVFAWPSHGLSGPVEGRTTAFRQRLLDAISADRAAVRDLDGEYQIAVWDAASGTLRIWLDRFAALPLYIATTRDGSAFAGGVRGVLAVPGVPLDPDPQALREAVSFGGFRLGGRTNLRAVRMATPAARLTMTAGTCSETRYWHWNELEGPDPSRPVTMEEMRAGWASAIRRRLEGAARPGLALSGGLDSRAILGEIVRQGRVPNALTYGVPECDDARFAAQAAAAVGAPWHLFPLFAPGWLERRLEAIGPTDGLIELVDLMHLEPAVRMPELFDVYVSGYLGDAVSGSSQDYLAGVDDVLRALPYYGAPVSIPLAEARACVGDLLARVQGAPRFLLYDHKFPQAIGRTTDAARPRVRVRRPFTDYAFFALAQRVDPAKRAGSRWHEQWLLSTYPRLFSTIPNQRTGVPAGSSRLRWQVTRAARYGWRRALAAARAAGAPVTVPTRSYHPDERYWTGEARALIEGTVLAPGSLPCEILGRERVADTVRAFFAAGAAPVQVIGAMFVYEYYHRHLASAVAAARQHAVEGAC